MAPFRPEEVTLPTRFLCTTAHLIAVLTVFFDVEAFVSQAEQIDPATSTNHADLELFDNRKKQVSGICYAAFACFGIDYIALFLGISMFFPPMMAFNIICHFGGTVLTVLLYTDGWSFASFVAFFIIFNALPAVVELFMLVFVTRFSFFKF
ncbi:Transmembrane protein 107 [Tetrabaena socialis]|uniref:Transmembrane protein 107 n=1 Tax=Tetrabaena socialis TaxID=47790 RepID=A0A2J8AKD4_9CHLO|nr:Transmembrane protein 107 [Tetrabaena socialis]|eukprot:PNH12981.1 Transmembrane protein 107 [Tetrabaena socialis]